MLSDIIVSVITGSLAVVGALVGNMAITRKKAREDALREVERETRQAMRLENIEHKLDIHNGYAEKLTNISTSMIIMQKDMEYLKKEVENAKPKIAEKLS